jgi:DHA1 family inner membrane transport protein
MKSLPVPLIALALSSFAIGTTEFVIMGLLPQVASSLAVSIPTAGWLVSGYALGVFIGAPIMAILTQKLAHRSALMALMGIFILGNALCALSPDYDFLMLARIITALCHGAFFGIGAVEAASLVAPDKRAQAIALMFTGLTLANVLGVPLGTALGQAAGWRTTFWAVTGIGLASLISIFFLLPRTADKPEHPDMLRELTRLTPAVYLGLSITVVSSASIFAMFTYIAPLLNVITHVSPRGVSYTLFLIGTGLTLGNVVGGRLADWRLLPTLCGVFVVGAPSHPGRGHALPLGALRLHRHPRTADQPGQSWPRGAEPDLHPQHRRLQRRQRARRLGRRIGHRVSFWVRRDSAHRIRALSCRPGPYPFIHAAPSRKDSPCQPCLTR